MVAFVAFSASAQQSIHKDFGSGTIQRTVGEKKAVHLNITQLTATDTVGNLQPCDTAFSVWYLVNVPGFLSGHNGYIDSAKAERYQGVTGDSITGLWVYFGAATYTNSLSQKCHLRIWDDNGAGNTPGTILGNVDLTHKSIADDIAAGNVTTVYFPTALAMPAGGNFYAGVELDYKLKQGLPTFDETRAVALVNSDLSLNGDCGADTSLNTAWEKYSDGIWHSYVYSYGIGARNPVFPIVQTTDCSITINPTSASVCKGKSTVLTASGAATYSWAPSTGLNCTTCASVTAKPNSTTTYTVTGDGGTCSATLKVTVNKVTAAVSQGACNSGAILLTRSGVPTTGVTFKWYKNNAVISGATNSTYSATSSGDYKVRVTQTSTGCSKTSGQVTVTINCKNAQEVIGFDASVYPNPFTKSMSVNISAGSSEPATVTLLNYSGSVVREYNNVDPNTPFEISENLSMGIYFVKVVQGTNERMLKAVKND